MIGPPPYGGGPRTAAPDPMEQPSLPDAACVSRRISTIVPARNYGRFLRSTLDGILRQAVADLEVIVVDDCSTDDTAAVVAAYGSRVRYARQAVRKGAGAAANLGTRLSTGEFLAFLDADDLWSDDKLSRQLAVLDADPRIDAVFGHVEEFFSSDLDPADRSRLTLRRAPAPVAGAMLVRRSAYLRVGPFGEPVDLGEFLDWYARALDAKLEMVTLPHVVLRRRVHAMNVGRHAASDRRDYLRVLKQSIDRRRAAAVTADTPGG